ncbi:MAG: RDD family protein [Fulvimarina manganoxydans]|uniref:RDD family protein n=1 Tax=Fulvimarina manganoxydans TaxID=937218 RepID=UPI00235657ED|nr:RDD family protein [Fulvimarina manganoxydans]MCK5930809.1 RDD family protein [Fulvimarina manganoxydans]
MTDTAAYPQTDLRTGALDDWRRYRGVRTRRIMSFILDYTFVLLLSLPAAFVVFLLGIVSFGLGWGLYAVLLPVVAILYVGFTMGGRTQATPGMRMAGVEVRRLDGEAMDPPLAVLHGVLFWASTSVLTPFILLVSLFTRRKQLLHDLLLGTVIIRRH